MKLVVSIFILSLLIFCCKGQNIESDREATIRVAKNVRAKRLEYQKELIANIDFSPGAQEVIEWVDYRSPLVAGYTPTEIKTVLEFNSLISSGQCEALQ